MANNAIGWFEIYVQDMARARAFYETVFQVTLTPINPATPELWSFPGNTTSYGCGGALAHMPGMNPGGNSTIVYFACRDCAVEVARVVPAGGRVMKEKFAIGQYGFSALAVDTEGNLIGFHSMR